MTQTVAISNKMPTKSRSSSTKKNSSCNSKKASRSSRQSNTSVRSEQEPVQLSPAQMSNEMRMKVYAKKLFAEREYCGYLVFRNAPKDTNNSNQANISLPQRYPLINPIASTIGSKIFSKPDYDELESDSSLRMDTNKSNSKSQGPSSGNVLKSSIIKTSRPSNSKFNISKSKTSGSKSNARKK